MTKRDSLLGVSIEVQSKKDILEKIRKDILESPRFFHIVSLNPENFVAAQKNAGFKKVVNTAQMCIVDGIGVQWACHLLGVPVGERVTGVDLMDALLKEPFMERLRVMLIGGAGNLAEKLADCYQQLWPQAKIVGLSGIKNIQNPTSAELEEIFSIVTAVRPHLVFIAFGSPYQELWIEANRDKFGSAVVMGVGGAFDFLAGRVRRAPKWLQTIGGEWFFRLLIQPWRLKRQLRLVEFCWLVLREKFKTR